MQPQPNPKLNKVDYFEIFCVAIGALSMLADLLPSKYFGEIMILSKLLTMYSKFLGTKEQIDALQQGQELGKELKQDISIMEAKKPL